MECSIRAPRVTRPALVGLVDRSILRFSPVNLFTHRSYSFSDVHWASHRKSVNGRDGTGCIDDQLIILSPNSDEMGSTMSLRPELIFDRIHRLSSLLHPSGHMFPLRICFKGRIPPTSTFMPQTRPERECRCPAMRTDLWVMYAFQMWFDVGWASFAVARI